MAAVALDDEIYVIGGKNGVYYNLLEKYLPSGDSWESLAPMSTPRDLLVAAVAEPEPDEPRIYAIGGRNPIVGNGIVEMYDPGSDTWIARQPMNVARFGAVAGVVNNKIYVIGGRATTEITDTVEAYDPTTDTWTLNFDGDEEFQPLPEPLAFAGAAVVNDKIYVIGGRTNSADPGNPDPSDVRSSVYEFDPSDNTWTRRADIPIPRVGEIPGRNRMTTAVVGGKIYMIGGANYPDRWLDAVQVYTPASNTWENMNWMPIRQGDLASGVVEDTIYVFGGVRSWDGQTVDYSYAFDVNCSNNPPDPPSDPSPMAGMSARVDTVLSWSGGDPDGDDVTYDVYFSEAISPTVNTTPVLVSPGQVETTYVPTETLKPLTWYYWRIIAKDNSGAATSGQATMTISDTVTIVDRWGFRTAPGPVIDVEKTTDPDFLPVVGGTVTFTVKVTNIGTEDVNLTGLEDKDKDGNLDLDGQGTCATGGQLLPSDTYECTFTKGFSVGLTAGEVLTDTVTATAENVSEVEARAQANASVEILSEVPSIRVTKSAEPTSIPETGGTVDYTVEVLNISTTPLTLTELVDHSSEGDLDLNGQGDCATGGVIPPTESYQCTFSATISGNAFAEHTNTVTATATDGNTEATGSGDATVTFTDALPEVSITKSANPTSVNEPGGIADYSLVVTNPGQEAIILTSMEDNRFGELDGQGNCELGETGVTVLPEEDYKCDFSKTIFGVVGEQHTNQVMATIVDDELNEVFESSNDVTVTFTKGVMNHFLYLPILRTDE
jgi:N-acetylneuraminic acid mutarotase